MLRTVHRCAVPVVVPTSPGVASARWLGCAAYKNRVRVVVRCLEFVDTVVDTVVDADVHADADVHVADVAVAVDTRPDT